MELTISQAKNAIQTCMAASLTPYIVGQAGIGKSEMILQIAKEKNLEVIDIRLSQIESIDLNGYIRYKEETGKAGYAPIENFPLANDEIPNGKNGWILFLDELTQGEIPVLHAAYKLIQDRSVGNHKLHEKCYLVCAGNGEDDNAFVNPMPSPLKSRLVHLNMIVSADDWLKWAYENDYNSSIIGYITWKKESLSTEKTRANDKEHAYACPRTWSFVDKILKSGISVGSHECKSLIAGCVGEAIQSDFYVFMEYKDKLPTYEEIIANPKKVEIPDEFEEVGRLFAMLVSFAQSFQKEDVKEAFYFVERLPLEFARALFVMNKNTLELFNYIYKEQKTYFKKISTAAIGA